MKKRIISLFMVLALLISVADPAVLAQGEDEADPAQTEAAAGSPAETAREFLEKLTEYATERAGSDAERAKRNAELAALLERFTKEAAEKAEGATSPDEAKEAADGAEDASSRARRYAGEATLSAFDAVIHAGAVMLNAQLAESGYQLAQKLYDAAKAEADRQLARGLTTAGELVELAERAEEAARVRHEEAEEALKAAEEADNEQKEAVALIRGKLREDLEELNTLIRENATEVAKDAGLTLATGAALEAGKLVVQLADAAVESYQKQYDELYAQVKELDDAIEVCESAISDAQGKLTALKLKLLLKGILNADGEYKKALLRLQTAQNALEEAKLIQERSEELLALKEQSGYAARMAELQEKVRTGTGTAAEVAELTAIIFNHLPEYGISAEQFQNVTPVEGEDGLYQATALVDGQEITVYIRAQVEGGKNAKVVQYYRAEEASGKPLQGGNALSDYVNAQGYEDDQATPLLSSNDTYVIKAVKNSKTGRFEAKAVNVNTGEEFSLSWNSSKQQYSFKTGILSTVYIDVLDPDQTYYKIADENPALSSDAISGIWEQLNDPAQNVTEKAEALDRAQSEFDTAWGDYKELVDIIEINTKEKERLESDPEAKAIREQLEKLDQKLNGNLGARLITALINAAGPELIEMAVAGELDVAALTSLLGSSWDSIKDEMEGKSLLEILGSLGEAAELIGNISDIVSGVTDGDLQTDDVKAVLDLLTGDTMSLKMKQAVAHALEALAQGEFDKAKANLEAAVHKAREEIVAQGQTLLADGEALAEEELAYLAAETALAEAKLKEALASRLEELAEAAADEAEKAYDALQELQNAPRAEPAALKAAQAAYETAQELADRARQYAEEAVESARAAREEAKKASDNADYARNAYEKLLAAQKVSFVSNAPHVDFDALRAVNPDIVGWLSIPGTGINYPIVQGKDNEYYTDHLFNGAENEAGCLFLDADCESDFSSVNSVIYGNSENGGMFTDLLRFTDSEFLNAHRRVWLVTPEGDHLVTLDSAKSRYAGDKSFAKQTGTGHVLTLTTFENPEHSQRVVVTGNFD